MEKTLAVAREEKRRYWQAHLDKWQDSGLTQAVYCRKEDLSVHQFLYWKKRLLPHRASASFVEIQASELINPAPFPSSPSLILVLSGRYRIEVNPGFDPETLERIARVVERLP